MPGIAWKRSNWVEWAAVPLVCTAMIASWARPLLSLVLGLSIISPRGLDYPVWLIMAMLLGASAAKRVLPRTRAGRAAGAALGLVVIVIVLIGLSPYRAPLAWPSWASIGQTVRSLAEWGNAIPATFLLIIISAVLWARGLAADWTDHEEIWRAFALGVLVFGFLILLPGRTGTDASLSLGRSVMSFLLTGLLALALLAALDVLSIQQPFGRRAAGLNRYWLSAVVLALVAIVFLGWLLGQILAPDAVAQFVRWFDPLRRFIGQVLSFALTGIVYVVFLALMAIFRLVSRWIGQPDPDTAQAMQDAEDLFREAEEGTRSLSLSPELRLILVLLFLSLGALSLFWLAWRQRRRQIGRDGVVEERQSIGSLDLLLDQLGKLLKRLPPVEPFLDLSSIVGPRRAIRLLYQHILAAAKSAGHPRAPGQTPSSYENSLSRVLPAQRSDLQTLTEAYLAARYGGEDLDGDVVGRATGAAGRIEQALRQHRRP